MPDWMTETLVSGQEVALDRLIGRLLVAFVFGAAIAAVYRLTHRRDVAPMPSFATTLVLLGILMAVVTQVVGNNLARAFSLAGALSIVRFRTVVEDTRDIAFVVFVVVVGMAIGAGHPLVALVALIVAGAAAAVVRPRLLGNVPWLLTVRVAPSASPELPLQDLFNKHLRHVRLLATCTARQGSALELTYQIRLRPTTTPAAFASDLTLIASLQHLDLKQV